MKTKFFALFILSCLFCVNMHAQVFVIERGTSTTLTFSDIKAAVDALEDGDRLYIPSGRYSVNYSWTGYTGESNLSGILVINKKVFIYGAGYNEGANSTVIDNGIFMIGKDAGGTIITGIRFDGAFQLDNVSNCIVSHCKMNSGFFLNRNGNNINIIECEITSYFRTTNSTSYTNLSSAANIAKGLKANVSKCVFNSSPYVYDLTLSNCHYLNGIGTHNNCVLSNNVFIVSATVTNSKHSISGSDNTFNYNLWVGGYPESGVSNNNIFKNEMDRETYSNVFVDPTKGDYRLKDECIGKKAGSDGTDVGIFGTTIPFKENKLPSIPSFTTKVISTETDATGKLPVNIVIEAQER